MSATTQLLRYDAMRHRIAAARKLGWTEIEVRQFEGDETAARLWEIAENLHRADLTVAERAAQIAEWVRLTGEKVAQVAPVSPKGGRGHEGGINAAVRELGIDRYGLLPDAAVRPCSRSSAKFLRG